MSRAGLHPRGADVALRRTRGRFVETTVVCVVATLGLLLGVKLALMQVMTDRGLDHLEERDFASAEQSFRVNLIANWFEPWRAPYNLGVSLYEQDKWVLAQRQFTNALEDAPDDKICLVALNLSLSHEAEGDQLERRGDFVHATQAWRKAESVAKEAKCSGEDGEKAQAASESRTGEKAEDAAGDAEDQKSGGEGDAETDQPSEQQKADALEKSNQDAQENRQQSGGRGAAERSGPGGDQGTPSW